MYYALTINNNIISGVHESMSSIAENAFESNVDYAGHDVRLITAPMDYMVDQDIRAYNEDGTFKPLSWRVENGYYVIPDGYQLEGETLQPLPMEFGDEVVIEVGDTTINANHIFFTSDTIDDLPKDIVQISKDVPFTEEELAALTTSTSFIVKDPAMEDRQYMGYKNLYRHSVYLYQTDFNAEELENKIAEIEVLVQEKEELIQEKETIVAEKTAITNTVKSYLRTQTNDTLIALANLISYWEEDGTYIKGDPVKVANGESYSLYTAIQSHEALNDPNRAPAAAPTLWAIYHAKSAQYALPYVAPTHAEDMYKQNEYMIFDEKIYKCLVNTDRDPTVLPNSWQEVDVNGDPVEPVVEEPGEGEEPQEPVEKNSNGTDVWSEWVVWNNHPATLYKIGDRVTLDGTRYIATLDSNHWSPTSGTGWAVAPE